VPLDGTPITIGRPLANTTLYVLDAAGERVPPGLTGELYIGGAGLAHGYLNRPAMTAERFLADPFSGVPGARMYRTGDRVRFRADGRVEYLGRADHQVKLRGFRIELQEIETVLESLSSVADAIAMLHASSTGEPQLIAYVRPAEGAAPEAAALRTHLRDKLPAYMVPAQIVTIDAWPRTPNGKVDRKALPKPAADAGSQAAYVAPQTDAERKIAEVWCELLEVQRVGARDNFFDLGGHSLLALRITTRLREEYGIDLALRDFFEAQTVEQLAELVKQAMSVGDQEEIEIT
jgi:acyl carrier protein